MKSSYSGDERRCNPVDCGIGEVKGELSIIRELLSDHIEVSRKNDADQLAEINLLKTEITKYKVLFRAVVGTAICIATFEWGDIASLWR